jgi:serine phosphatase RsbU (regulator of sigma subunit)
MIFSGISGLRSPPALKEHRSLAPVDGSGVTVTRWSSPAGKAQAGGDWCEVFSISEDVLAVTVGDVSGHGESVADAAAFMRSATVRAFRQTRDPAEILSIVNTAAYEWADGVIVTAIAGVLDRRRRTFTFANAGHPPPIIVGDAGDKFLAHLPADLPLGIFSTHRAADYVIAFPSHALIALYTDGITEHERDPVKGEHELARACRLVHAGGFENAALFIAELVLLKERGHDDAAVLAVRIEPA